MQYISTRGAAAPLEFEAVLLEGLARDGGLYVPDHWPVRSADQWRSLRGLAYPDLAFEILRPFVAGAVADEPLRDLLEDAYAGFTHSAVAPLRQIGADAWLMELFHGPTLAFKDVAMQVLGRLYDLVLERRGESITIVGATSGDTGSAAIEAIRGREHARIFILHPHGRTSEVQRRQMTTVREANVFNIAIEGTFDDCQNLVKAMFGDAVFRDRVRLSGVNSINWARIMPQVVYYVAASLALGGPDRPVDFSVPTGNFGDVFAGYVAAKMGLPIGRLVVASNSNDILTRTLRDGDHSLTEVVQTTSPSMDIQISSNFERLLFDLHDRDGAAVAQLMRQLRETGAYHLSAEHRQRLASLFTAERANEAEVTEALGRIYRQTGILIDPHTAVGVVAAERQQGPRPMVTLATAHPAKFPDAVERATGVRPALPPHLADLWEREEVLAVLPNDLAAVQAHVLERVG